jgi:hypothetical protein
MDHNFSGKPIMKTTNESATHAWYALRRTLVPWHFDEALSDLLAYCRKVPIDEIILKCDTEEFSHGQPSIEWLAKYQPRLIEARDALAEMGIVYSLNPWVTQGHNDRGRDIRPIYPDMRLMVGHRGEEAHAQVCPLCPAWRKYVESLWTLYAETNPHVIWIEDDIRTFNHDPITYGCFCKEHLRRFGERVGEFPTREDLVDAIFAAGNPHPWRREWLLLQREVMEETVGLFERVVHAVSPDSRMGLMSSGPENHVLCGRDWPAFARTLAGDTPLYSRAPLGNYNEVSLRGLYLTAREVRATRSCLPDDTVEQTEVENWWFSQYSKSVTFTALQISACLILGGDGLTMNLYDHIGTPLSDDTTMGPMLKEQKPFFSGISERCRGKAPCGGVRILHNDHSAIEKRLSEGVKDCYELTEDSFYWDEFLAPLGFATTWDESPVIAASGQVLRAFSDQELIEFLSRGMLLDLTSLEVLHERGFAALTGVEIEKVMPRNSWPSLAAEDWHEPAFGGAERNYLTMSYPKLDGNCDLAMLKLLPGAIEVSGLVNADNLKIAPGITAFENKQGGRIVILPTRLETDPGSLLNPKRKKQFSHLLNWLFHGEVPLEVICHNGAYPLPVRRNGDGHTVLSALNLSLDAWSMVSFRFASGGKKIAKVEHLDQNGKWKDIECLVERDGDMFNLTYNQPVACATPLLLDITWE